MTSGSCANMILGVTGHRPYVWNYDRVKSELLQKLVAKTLRALEPAKVITGMALGFDQEVALACYRLKIPFIAAVPFEGQSSKWPKPSRAMYDALLKEAAEVVILSQSTYDPELMKRRNAWIIRYSEAILTLYNGEPSSGTQHAINLAKSKNLDIYNIWPEFLRG